MGSTLVGLILLASRTAIAVLLVGALLVGIGSAVFHPESSRIARMASGGRHGLAQSLFQVGGNFGTSLGPLLAAFIVLPRGQSSIAWFAVAALLGIVILWRVERVGDARPRPAKGERRCVAAAPFSRAPHASGARGAGDARLLEVHLHGEPDELLHVLYDA